MKTTAVLDEGKLGARRSAADRDREAPSRKPAARRVSASAAQLKDAATSPRRLRQPSGPSASRVIQGQFYERTAAGAFVWWRRPMSWAGGAKAWRPWIDPATGVQGQHNGYGVWFQFNKTGLDRQKVKGTRPTGGDSTGLVLGDQAEHAALGLGAWPGSRAWPGAMGTAAAARAGVAGAAAAATNSWGHQVAMQWGGPAAQWNASSATNAAGAGANAQELYQTAVEDAVTYVVANHGIPLNEFRIKHTAYNYQGTHVAKYMRIKIYHQAPGGPIRQVVDQVTPDFASFLAGGRAQAGTARRAFQMQIENQLQGAVAPARAPTRGTDPTAVRSWNAAATPNRARRCFLTTACVEFKGLPDDCVELTELRAFRDGPMQRMRDGRRLIAEYYRLAPGLVTALERHPARREMLERLYHDLVVASIFLIRAGRHRAAVANYRREVLRLRDRLRPRKSRRGSRGTRAKDN